MPKLKLQNNLGLDNLPPDLDLDPTASQTESRSAHHSDMLSGMWLPLQKYGGGESVPV
jgi:hypothetical protein